MSKDKREHTSDEKKIIGRNVLNILHSRDLSMSELSRYCEIHRSYMSRMLRGEGPLDEYLPPITKFLNTTMEDLLSAGSEALISRKPTLPWGALDENGRQSVPNGCVLQRIDDKTDAHPSAGRWVLLGPQSVKPAAGALVWCELLDKTTYVRQYIPDARDPRRFILSNNVSGDGPVALDRAQVAELRVVAIENLKLGE